MSTIVLDMLNSRQIVLDMLNSVYMDKYTLYEEVLRHARPDRAMAGKRRKVYPVLKRLQHVASTVDWGQRARNGAM